MDTKNIERADGKLKFQVLVDPAAFEEAVNKAYLQAKRRIMVPGFRKGKAPRMVIEGMYGADVFYDDAVNGMALDAFQAGVKEAGDRTVGDPEIVDYNVDDDKSLTISYAVDLYPEVTLGAYKGLEAYKAPSDISDEEVSREIEAARKRSARIVAVDRGAQNGDSVNLDFDGYVDGKRFKGGKAEGYKLVLGSHSFVDTFEDQLLGSKAGEELDVKVTFPQDYAPELAGKDAVFKVKINEVQETQLPDLDDEFAKDVSEFDTLDEYKESIRKELQEKRQETCNNNFRTALIRKASENMTVEIPDSMINQRVNAMIEDLARRCRAQGMQLAQYFQMMGVDERSYRGYIRVSAAADVRTELLLEKVAETEGLEVTPEELEEEYKRTAELYEIDLEKMKNNIPENIVVADMKMKKAGDLIMENGIATDKPEEPDVKPVAEEASAEETAEEGKE